MHISDCVGEAVHFGSIAEQSVLREPNGLLAQAIVDGTLVSLTPIVHTLLALDLLLVWIAVQRAHVRGGVQRGIAAAGTDSQAIQFRDEFGTR